MALAKRTSAPARRRGSSRWSSFSAVSTLPLIAGSAVCHGVRWSE